MSTKNYVSGTAVLLLILCSIASATLINYTTSYTGVQAIHSLWPDDRTLEVGPTGNVTFDARVNMDGGEGVPCQIIMNGGILNIAVGVGDAGLEVCDNATTYPERVYVNKGTMTCGRVNIIAGRNGKIIISGGTLIVQQAYLSGNDITDPARWVLDGRLEVPEGYELVFTDLGIGLGGNGNAVKIAAKRSSSNPAPADDDTIVNVNLPSLCWDSIDAKIYKVYFGTADANESNYAANLAYLGKSAVLDPNGAEDVCFALTGQLPLSAPQSYTWALAAYSNVLGGEPNGPVMDVKVYQFSTSAVPVVKVQPISTGYLAGQTAVFTAEVESYTALTSYNWYRSDAPGTPIAGAIQSLGGFRYRLTLTIPNVQWATQGKYYCTAANASGSVNTAEANLVVKAELAHWSFNNNLLDLAPKDVNPTVYNGTAAVTASYVASSGSDPNALDFDGTSQYVTVPSGFGNFRAGMTIAAYFRMDNSGNTNARLIEFGNSDPTQSVYLAHRNDTIDELTFFTGGTRGTEGNEGLRLNIVFNRGAWSHVVVTMDNAGNVICYKNGLPVAGATGTVAVPVQIPRDNNRIGWDRAGLVAKLNGRIGDLRVYNYAISADEAATLYADVSVGGWFCRNAQNYDWSGDCAVDFADFVSLAKAWQDCGIYPASACP